MKMQVWVFISIQFISYTYSCTSDDLALRSLEAFVEGCVAAFREGVTISEKPRQASRSARLKNEQMSAVRITHTNVAVCSVAQIST